MRIFPLSNWTELDVWEYIRKEQIPVVPLYFAKEREMLIRGDLLLPLDHPIDFLPGETPQCVMCRMRSLGCTYCTGAIRSRSERENRVIDHDQEGSMELKKIEGYF
jgi:sulfate adenylyltransferase subunit 2